MCQLEAFFQAGDSALGAVRKKPCLVVLNKKDAIKPGELAKKLQVSCCTQQSTTRSPHSHTLSHSTTLYHTLWHLLCNGSSII